MNHVQALSDNCESLFARNEKRARQSAEYYRERLDLPQMPTWLQRMVDTTVVPALTRIGLEKSFVTALFQIAMSAWESTGKTGDNILPIDPKARSEVAEVEQGLLHRAQKTYDIYFLPSQKKSQAFFETVEKQMHPRNLFDLLEDVTTSWIILPRAYRFLERKHCRYLPHYLEMLMHSKNELCLDKWIRITIEFMANYTIKFADEALAFEKVVNFVIHGYEAVFWHTLNSPPTGFEDNRIFEHYLSWMSHSDALASPFREKVSETTERMRSGIQSVFPSGNVFKRNADAPRYMPCVKIALRHGCLGIVTTGRYFWIGNLLTCGQANRAIDYRPMLIKLRNLFNQIKVDYPNETSRTQYFIKDFVHQFETAYRNIQFPIEGRDELSNGGIQFLVAQILQSTANLRRSL